MSPVNDGDAIAQGPSRVDQLPEPSPMQLARAPPPHRRAERRHSTAHARQQRMSHRCRYRARFAIAHAWSRQAPGDTRSRRTLLGAHQVVQELVVDLVGADRWPEFGRRIVGAVAWHDPRGQSCLATRRLPERNGRIANPATGPHYALDLREFDAVSAQLDLIVRAPAELELAIRVQPRPVAGAVGAHRIPIRPTQLDETLGRQLRRAEIAARDAGAGHVQLALPAARHRHAAFVQQQQFHVTQRPAQRTARVVAATKLVQRDLAARLGDGIGVEQGRAIRLVARKPAADVGCHRRLTAQHDRAQRRAEIPGRDVVGQEVLPERARRLAHDRDALIAHEAREPARVVAQRGWHDHEPAAMAQRPPDLPDREPERTGVIQRPYVVTGDVEFRADVVEQARQVTVRHHHALRRAGRAGREHDVAELPVRHDASRSNVRGDDVRQVDERRRDVRHRRMRAIGHDGGRRGQRGDLGEPLFRQTRIQRQPGAAALHDAQHRDDQVDARRAMQGDDVVRANARIAQGGGHAVRAGIQLRIGEPRVGVANRERIGPRTREALDAGVQGSAGVRHGTRARRSGDCRGTR